MIILFTWRHYIQDHRIFSFFHFCTWIHFTISNTNALSQRPVLILLVTTNISSLVWLFFSVWISRKFSFSTSFYAISINFILACSSKLLSIFWVFIDCPFPVFPISIPFFLSIYVLSKLLKLFPHITHQNFCSYFVSIA